MKAVIFDFDGVLVDSEKEKFSIVQRLLRDRGYILPDSSFQDFIGMKTDAFLAERYPQMAAADRRSIVESWRAARPRPAPFMQMAKAMRLLRERGIRVGVVTGSQRDVVQESLEAMGVRGTVDVIVAGDEAPSKPSPIGFQRAMRALNVAPADTVVVEDSSAGAKAAADAGASVFIIGPADASTHRRFADHNDFLAYLEHELLDMSPH